jgi:hypothetical protein
LRRFGQQQKNQMKMGEAMAKINQLIRRRHRLTGPQAQKVNGKQTDNSKVHYSMKMDYVPFAILSAEQKPPNTGST